MEEKDLTPEELQVPSLSTKPEISVEELQKIEKEIQDIEDLNKKNYVKISPTLYIKSIESEEGEEEKLDEDGKKIEIFQILNPETNVVEKRELTDNEKHDVLVQQIKASHKNFHPTKYGNKTVGTSTITSQIGTKRTVKNKEIQNNLTVNKYGNTYRKKRKNKNKLTKASRRGNR